MIPKDTVPDIAVTGEMIEAGVWTAADLGVRATRQEVAAIFCAMWLEAIVSPEQLGLLHKVRVVGHC